MQILIVIYTSISSSWLFVYILGLQHRREEWRCGAFSETLFSEGEKHPGPHSKTIEFARKAIIYLADLVTKMRSIIAPKTTSLLVFQDIK